MMPTRTRFAIVAILLAMPLVLAGDFLLFDNRAYYASSLIIITLAMLPFVLAFEGRRPKARELVVIAVLVALAVAGRAAFFMIPQFKPVVALVIIAGITLGAESGFCVGALTGFVSNFFFGQGPWTPWQMFAFGIIGFIAGLLFSRWVKNEAAGTRLSLRFKLVLVSFGGLATFLIYGLLLDTATTLMFSYDFQETAFFAVILSGLPFNVMHAASTVIFLLVLADFMVAKIKRVKEKYGLLQRAELEPIP